MSVELKPCPFCGGAPVWDLGKKRNCQLHGEPMQSVILRCKTGDCSARPQIEAGDVYNGGQNKARVEVAALWNRRQSDAAAHARGIAEGLELAACLLDEQQAWHERQGLWVGASKMGAVAKSVRALPHDSIKADEGRG